MSEKVPDKKLTKWEGEGGHRYKGMGNMERAGTLRRKWGMGRGAGSNQLVCWLPNISMGTDWLAYKWERYERST